MTNENRVIELLRAFTNPVSNAILWERIQAIAAMTKEGATENPKEWSNPLISANSYIQWADKVAEIAAMEKPVDSVTCYLFMHDDAYQIYKSFTDDQEYFSLADCINAMDEDSCCIYEIYEHNEYDKSHELLYKATDYTNWVILSAEEMEALRKEGLV